MEALRKNQPDRGASGHRGHSPPEALGVAEPPPCSPAWAVLALPASPCTLARALPAHLTHRMLQTRDPTSPRQGRLKNRESSKVVGGHMLAAGTQRCRNHRPVLILYNREVSWLRFNCENSGSLCVQRTQNIFPFSFCHLNLLWLQKEVPPRTFNCLGKGSLRAESARWCQR